MEFRIVEHTADIGIEVEAGSLEELFAGAAAGMFSIIVDPETVTAVISRDITLHAADLEELMFAWLNELLYLLYAEALVPSRFEVKRIDGTDLEPTFPTPRSAHTSIFRTVNSALLRSAPAPELCQFDLERDPP